MNSLFSRANSSNKLVHNLEGDIRDFESLKEFAKEAEAEVVIHFAAQSLVRKSYKIPYETFDVNVVGTLNVLSAFRDLPTTRGGAVGLVDRLTCPTVWLPVLCEDQAGMDGLS
jgi:CDP-glucose 4,6-dehydratase